MKLVRIATFLFLCLFVLLLFGLAIAPSIISTSWGKGQVAKFIEKSSHCQVEIANLSFNWLKKSEIRGVTVKDLEGKPLIAVDGVIIHKPLIGFFWTFHDLGSIEILSPQVHHYPTKKEAARRKEPTVQKRQRKKENAQVKRWLPLPTRGRLQVSNAALYTYCDDEVIGTLSEGKAEIDINVLGLSKGSLGGTISQKGISCPLGACFEFNQSPHLAPQGYATLSCESLPTDFIGLLVAPLHEDLPAMLKEGCGSSLSCHLDARLAHDELSVSADLRSQNFGAAIALASSGSTVTLQPGTLLHGTVTPPLFSSMCHIFQVQNVVLEQPVDVSLENTLPLVFDRKTHAPTKPFLIRLFPEKNVPLRLAGEGTTLSFSTELHGDAHRTKLEVRANTLVSNNKTDLSLNLTLTPQSPGYHLVAEGSLQGEWPTCISKLTKSCIPLVLGEQCHVSARLEGDAESTSHYSLGGDLSVSSPLVNGHSRYSLDPRRLTLQQTSLAWHVPPRLLADYCGDKMFVSPENLEFSFSSPSLTFAFPFGLSRVEGDALCTFALPDLFGTTALSGSFQYTRKPKERVASIAVKCSAVPKEGLALTRASGGPVLIELQGLLDHETSTANLSTISVSCPNVQASVPSLRILWAKDFVLDMMEPATLTYSAPQGLLPAYAPLSATGVIAPSMFRLSSHGWNGKIHATSSGEFAIPKESPSDDPYRFHADLQYDLADRQFAYELTVDEQTGNSGLRASGTALLPEQISSDSLLNSSSIETTLDLQRIPVTLFGLSVPRLTTEDTISAHVQCQFSGFTSPSNSLSMKLQSPWGQAHCSLALNAKILSSKGKEALRIDTSLPSEFVNAFLRKTFSGISTSEPAQGSLTITSLSVDLSPVLAGGSVWKVLDTANGTLQITLSPYCVSKNNTPIWRTGPSQGNFTIDGKRRAIKCSLDCSGGSKEDVRVSLRGNIENAWNDSGISLDASTIGLDVDASSIPLSLLTPPKKREIMEAALGQSMTARGSLYLDRMKQGKLKADLKTRNFSCSCDGQVKGGVFTLQAPATASFVVTKRIGEAMFSDVHPLLATVIHSEDPIKVRIDPAGTSIPLRHFSLSGISIPNITVTTGKFQVQNTGVLKIILALLKQGKSASKETLDVWMTPLFFSMDRGVLKCSRADALVADDVHLITWGNVDLVGQQIDMTIAIPTDVLQKLGLQIVTSTPERGLQIPIRGTPSSPKVDTKRATAKLAGATIVSGARNEKMQILGTLVQAAASVGEVDQPIPPPTTQPFPWEQSDQKKKR